MQLPRQVDPDLRRRELHLLGSSVGRLVKKLNLSKIVLTTTDASLRLIRGRSISSTCCWSSVRPGGRGTRGNFALSASLGPGSGRFRHPSVPTVDWHGGVASGEPGLPLVVAMVQARLLRPHRFAGLPLRVMTAAGNRFQ